VFVICLFTWQDIWKKFHGVINVFLGKSNMVFVDKFCIDQLDKQRKAAAILGSGGFLRHTDRLILCWTPRYISRLWCSYEIASWLHLGRFIDDILSMPSSIGTVVVIGSILVSITQLIYFCMIRFFWSGLLPFACTCMIIAPLHGMFIHVTRGLSRDLVWVPKQINAFLLASAQCFCCSVSH